MNWYRISVNAIKSRLVSISLWSVVGGLITFVMIDRHRPLTWLALDIALCLFFTLAGVVYKSIYANRVE